MSDWFLLVPLCGFLLGAAIFLKTIRLAEKSEDVADSARESTDLEKLLFDFLQEQPELRRRYENLLELAGAGRRAQLSPESRPLTATPPTASIPYRTVPMPAAPSRGQPPMDLPTRGSLKAPVPPPGFGEPAADVEPAPERAPSPHGWPSRDNDDDYSASTYDRVGTLGIAIAVIAASLAAWLLFWMFKAED